MKVKEPSLCIDRFVYGGTRCDEYPFLTGGFAEYLYLLPRAAFVKVTKDIPVESALLSACALRTAFHALDLTNGIDLGSQVLIQGVGSVGLMMVALANESGAKEIIVIDASEERLRLAEEFGATQTISIEKMKNSTDRVKRVFESTDQNGADLAYCCTKSSVAVTEGIEMLRNGGKYVLIGYPGPTTLDLAVTVIQRGITIYGCRSSEPNHLIRSVELLETRRDKYPFQKVVGSIFPLSETNEALKAALMLEATKAAVNPWL
jgi:threonine dehydrogenase-like Zn-dependent dehydrogenase